MLGRCIAAVAVCKGNARIWKYRKARGTVVDLLLSLRVLARKHSLDVFGQNVELEIQ
jgi:hypothetical protein